MPVRKTAQIVKKYANNWIAYTGPKSEENFQVTHFNKTLKFPYVNKFQKKKLFANQLNTRVAS